MSASESKSMVVYSLVCGMRDRISKRVHPNCSVSNNCSNNVCSTMSQMANASVPEQYFFISGLPKISGSSGFDLEASHEDMSPDRTKCTML